MSSSDRAPSTGNVRAEVLQQMPAVELFAVSCATGRSDADYPFTAAFYESAAYMHYKKVHFADVLPRVMKDIVGADGSPQRSLILWDARFIGRGDVAAAS